MEDKRLRKNGIRRDGIRRRLGRAALRYVMLTPNRRATNRRDRIRVILRRGWKNARVTREKMVIVGSMTTFASPYGLTRLVHLCYRLALAKSLP
jgi:hypothetical protein